VNRKILAELANDPDFADDVDEYFGAADRADSDEGEDEPEGEDLPGGPAADATAAALDLFAGDERKLGGWEPSADEIRAGCLEAQRHWTERERWRRAGYSDGKPRLEVRQARSVRREPA
jgi:hypothetical protein